MLRIRIVTAIIILPVVIAAVFAGGWWFLLTVGVIAGVAGWEFDRMMKVGGYTPHLVLMLVLIELILLDAFLSLGLASVLVTAALALSLFWELFQKDDQEPMAAWALTLAGTLYVGWTLAHLVLLRQLPDGLAWVWLVLLATWGADAFAYLAGSRWGRHKIWPRLSPKKSWEGLLGSIVGGLLGAVVVIFSFQLPWSPALLIAAVTPVVAFFGDVAESMMKRDVGVKDSSNLLPGHGGMLDRIDSMLFVSVLVYYGVIWLG
jgi:phosphatidate cytidylyltransferase